jgi:hypothetical protein
VRCVIGGGARAEGLPRIARMARMRMGRRLCARISFGHVGAMRWTGMGIWVERTRASHTYRSGQEKVGDGGCLQCREYRRMIRIGRSRSGVARCVQAGRATGDGRCWWLKRGGGTVLQWE